MILSFIKAILFGSNNHDQNRDKRHNQNVTNRNRMPSYVSIPQKKQKSSIPQPLTELEGKLTKFSTPDGREFDAISFACPICESAHWCAVPFSDEQIMYKSPNGVLTPIWKRNSGDSIENITLSPSFHLSRGCGLHGYIVDGKWRNC